MNESVKHVVLRFFPAAGDVRRLVHGEPPQAMRRQIDALHKRDERQASRLDRLRERADRLASRLARAEGRIRQLELEVQEARRLNKRIAELTDVVAEVLLPVDQRDDERIRAGLADYVESL